MSKHGDKSWLVVVMMINGGTTPLGGWFLLGKIPQKMDDS